MVTEKYGYAADFQLRIAALILRDPAFIKEYDDVVNPSYFDVEELTSLVRVCKNFYDKHKELPSKSSLVQEIKEFCSSYRIPESDSEAIYSSVDRIYNLDLIDPGSVKERVVRFGRRQAMKIAVKELAELTEQDSGYDKAVSLVENALRVGYNTKSLGLNLFPNLLKLPKMATRADRGIVHKIPTLIPTFDRKIIGGPGRGEIWTVLGLSGIGKTQLLVNMGASAVQQDFPVVHITVGDLDEEDVAVRYAGCLTSTDYRDIINESPSYMRKASKMSSYTGKYLRVKYYDPGTVTVAHIKAYISRLVAVDGIKPGMIIFDYPDEFKMDDDSNTYMAMGRVYNELKSLCKQYNCVGWAASQVNRWIPKKKFDVITRMNIADSSKKVHKADGIVSLNQTFEEHKAGKARLWVDKVRRGECYFLVPLDVDYSKSQIREGRLSDPDDD